MNNSNIKRSNISLNNTLNEQNKISNNSIRSSSLNMVNEQNKISSNSLNNTADKYKKILLENPIMAMFSIKNIYIDSVGLVLPWTVLLLIVGFLIIV